MIKSTYVTVDPFSSSTPPSKRLALILVEVVSPDIMYIALPWPEEEFLKMTVER